MHRQEHKLVWIGRFPESVWPGTLRLLQYIVSVSFDEPARHKSTYAPADERRLMRPSRPVPVSVVVIAKNEQANIERCVLALSWSDDVVVVDDYSTDDTKELAEASGARVVRHRFASFAQQRNWAMEHADLKHEWVLHLDADEVTTPEMWKELDGALAAGAQNTVAFRICRKTMMNGTWLRYADGFPVWIMRLVRNGFAAFEDQGHGEKAIPETDGVVGTIQTPLLHFAFSRGMAEWVSRHDRYSTLEAELESGDRVSVPWKQLPRGDRAARRQALRSLSRRLPFRPVLRFGYHFVLKRGFLDGSSGWQFSRMMATYERGIVRKRKETARATRSRGGA